MRVTFFNALRITTGCIPDGSPQLTEDSMKRSMFIATALASALTPIMLTAQKPAPTPSFKAEKCYGIAKAGKNDCASTGNNSCGGTSKVDKDAKAWIYVPEGYCERIVGGSKTAK
jgi:uncharacterized membrane protein